MKQNLPKVFITRFYIHILTLLILFISVIEGVGSNYCNLLSDHYPELQGKQVDRDTASSVKKENLSDRKAYRVQVCALHSKIKDISLLSKACGASSLIVEETDGYFKYLISDLSNYTDVLKTLYKLKSTPGFGGSFIVLYENGKRVKPLFVTKTNQVAAKHREQPATTESKENEIVPSAKHEAIKETKQISQPVQNAIVDTVKEKIETTHPSTTPVLDHKVTIHPDSPSETQKSINYVKGISNRYISLNLILFILVFFTVGFLILVAFLVLYHLRKRKRRSAFILLSELYAEKLAEYWSDQTENVPVPDLFNEAGSGFKKDILISEIISFLDTLTVEPVNKIKDLYYKLELDFYSFQKLHNRKWNIQAMGIHELAALDAQKEADAIEDFINHPNPVLRHEAISAIVRLRPSDPFGFLDRLRVAFTMRDQINALAVLRKCHLPVPAFSRWFDSYNPSVVAFAVEMVSLYNQMESAELFDKLLRHSYEEVRACVIKAIGDMHLTTYATRLIPIFNDEHEQIQLLILQTMGKLEDLSMLNFLSDIVLFNTSIKMRLEAAKALVDIGPQGLTRLQTLLLNQDKDISYIYHQICG